ncbi:MAG: SdrD B-like domain-containing protein [Peptoniphilus sp.]|nr:SdrD B-like domain-containing protein [Peptoniphilus sp.]MDY6044745.1 SdrD B-like domain-containing protein [Peptoniphilus sp.]
MSVPKHTANIGNRKEDATMEKGLRRFGLILALTMVFNVFAPAFSVPAQAMGEGNEAASYVAPTGENAANHIKVTNLNIQNKDGNKVIDPNQSGSMQMSFDFEITDNSVKAGNYFEIQLSENMNLNGDSTTVDVLDLTNSVGIVVANGHYDKPNNKIVYTFTDYVEHSINVKGHAQFPLFVDREHVTNNGSQTFTVTVAGESASTTLDVKFTLSDNKVDSFIPLEDISGETNKFTQVVYVNRMHEKLYDTKLTIRADHFKYNESENKIEEINTNSIATINKENTIFSIYKVDKNNQQGFPDSFGVDQSKYKGAEITTIEPKFHGDQNNVEYVTFDFGDVTGDGTGYIVVMESKTSGGSGGLRVSAKVDSKNVFGDEQPSFFWNNENIIETSDTDIEGENTYSLGDYVWEDLNKDGIQDKGEPGVKGVEVTLTYADKNNETVTKTTKTDENGFYRFSGLPNGEYTVTFTTPEGYELTKIKAGDDVNRDSNGLKTTVIIDGKDDYSIDLVRTGGGTFQDTHKYYIEYLDKEGKVEKTVSVDGATFTNKVQSGSNNEEFTANTYEKTAKNLDQYLKGVDRYEEIKKANGTFKYRNTSDHQLEKEGYVDEKTGAVKGNFETNKDQSITYNYYLQVSATTREGTFQETHRYYDIEKDFDGKEKSRKENKEAFYTTDKTSGAENETFTTKKDEKDGYKFTKVAESTDGTPYNKDGTPREGHYVNGKDQSVTYEYEKVKQPGRFEDTHAYYIVYTDKDGNETRRVKKAEHTNPYQEGYRDQDRFRANKEEKDGYTFEKVAGTDGLETPNYYRDGVTDGTYMTGRCQHITYIYTKTERDPEDPVVPAEPTDPKDPQKPENPKDPQKPENSKGSEKSEESKDLGKSEDPKDLGKSENSYTDKFGLSNTSTTKKHLPKTGAGVDPGIYAKLMALAGGAVTILGVKKRKEDEK